MSARPTDDHELLAAAARAVLESLREPCEQRQLPRAALGALKLLETALKADAKRRNKPA